jgi:hypothetical protein
MLICVAFYVLYISLVWNAIMLTIFSVVLIALVISSRSEHGNRMRETACNQTQAKTWNKKGPNQTTGLGFCYDAQQDLLGTNLLAQRDF